MAAPAFTGFPPHARFVLVPEAFVTALLPQMEDPAEIKATLHIVRSLSLKRAYPRFLLQPELESDRALVAMVGGVGRLREILERMEQRGTLFRLAVKKSEQEHLLYFLNDEPSRQAREKIIRGTLPLGEMASSLPLPDTAPPHPNIYKLYEDNIGLLTPMVAEELKEAEKQYPASWIEDAFKEAVAQNKRRWRYVARILERWATEGRGDGTTGRHLKEDPEKYFKGRYGHIVRR